MNNENKKIIRYNTQTGEPIFENRRIVCYNTQTGEPIYEDTSNIQQENKILNNLVNPTFNNQQKKKKSFKPLIFCLVIILVIVLVIGFIVLFSGNDKNYTRTMMIYMVGSNLESESGLATVDLNGIKFNSMDNKNINVVLIAGGSKKWDNDYIDVNETSIYELTENGFEKVKTNSIQNMGSPDALSDFLNYVYRNYKTDKYDLILWNHGGAISGSEYDDLSEDNLSLADFKQGLENSPFNDNNRLEIIFFRTCLNGTIEVANVFSDYADYLVASEEITMGYQFNSVLKFINDIETSDSAYDISLKFIDRYKAMVKDLNEIYYSLGDGEDYIYSTYSIIDLSNVKQLSGSVNEFFADIDVSSNFNDISKIRSNLYQYASDTLEFDMVDLYNLVDSLKYLSPDKADKVLNNLNKTVLYNWATNSESRGISIYFPYNGNNKYKQTFLTLYNDFDDLQSYNQFIQKFYNLQTSSKNYYTYSQNSVNISSSKEEADFTLELTDEQKETFAKAGYIVFRDNKDGYYLPVYSSRDVKLDGNTLKANIKDRQLKVVSTSDDGENILTSTEVENTDEYIKYKTVVTLEDFTTSEWKMDPANMTLIYDKKSGKTKIGNITLIDKNEGTPNTVAVNLNDYSTIAFASSSYHILDENGNYNENWESNGTIRGIEEKVGKFDFELQSYDDEYDYYCVFKIWDTNNDYYYSKLVKMN